MVRTRFIVFLCALSALAGCGGGAEEMAHLAHRLDNASKGAVWSEPALLGARRGVEVAYADGALDITTAFCGGAQKVCKDEAKWERQSARLELSAVDAGSIEIKTAAPAIAGDARAKGFKLSYACAGGKECWSGEGVTAAPDLFCRRASSCRRMAKNFSRLVRLAQSESARA